LIKAPRADLADSALHAPQAGFGDEDFYPEPFDKAAVLTCRLAWNHPLPDGNKRAAWAALVMFIDLNDGIRDPDPPDVDDAEDAMLKVAASEVDEAWIADWLRDRVHFD
jgi:death-on-curing protein